MILGDAASFAIKRRLWLPTTEPFPPPAIISYPAIDGDLCPKESRTVSEHRSATPVVTCFHLTDALLAPTRFVHGLVSLHVHYMGYNSQDSST